MLFLSITLPSQVKYIEWLLLLLSIVKVQIYLFFAHAKVIEFIDIISNFFSVATVN